MASRLMAVVDELRAHEDAVPGWKVREILRRHDVSGPTWTRHAAAYGFTYYQGLGRVWANKEQLALRLQAATLRCAMPGCRWHKPVKAARRTRVCHALNLCPAHYETTRRWAKLAGVSPRVFLASPTWADRARNRGRWKGAHSD